jgi:hypothetical protein
MIYLVNQIKKTMIMIIILIKIMMLIKIMLIVLACCFKTMMKSFKRLLIMRRLKMLLI